MDIVGVTFNGEMKSYIAIKTLKVSKWIDPQDSSLEAIFRLTIEHKRRENRLRKLKELYMYLKNEDLRDIDEKYIEKSKKEKRDISDNKKNEIRERISPLKGYNKEIPVKKVKLESHNRKKRIKIILDNYNIPKEDSKMNIKFRLKFKKSIDIAGNYRSTEEKTPWFYDCLIEPYLVQTLKWKKREFMPSLESLEVWLQIPKELYRSLSQINVLPVGHFEQMFLLGKENAEKFREAKQALAEEDTLCINWTFSGISISHHPEEIEVTCGLKRFTEEENFINRFKTKENPIIILREILYTCKVKTLDFRYIISNVSENLKDILEILNIMVFQRYSRSVKENQDLLLQYLEPYQDLPYGREFFIRYQIFNTLLRCKRSEDFFSDNLLSMLRQVQELEDVLDPDYMTLMQDFKALGELTQKTRYKDEILSQIDDLDHEWEKLIYPDRYILIDILDKWKSIVEEEYEEKVLLPEIKAEIKTEYLAFSDNVGFILSIENIGAGEAKEVHARLIQTDEYSIITGKSEMKTLLTNKGRPFEPELAMNPNNAKRTAILYEIHYKDSMGRDAKREFEKEIDFIKEKIPFQKIENPYIIGDIVRDERMFFGRKELLEEIFDNFRGKYQINPIFLYGQRRTGKTSILFHLEKKLEKNFIPVFLTTSEIFGKKSFYVDLMEKIREKIGFNDLKIPDIESDPFDLFKKEFYAKLKNRLKGKEIVLMIDEYQRIDELIAEGYYDESVIDFLNALVQDGEIKVILAGFLPPDELHNNKWVEFMRFFTSKNVSFLGREDTTGLICEPVRGIMKYDEGAIEKIISLSGRHPYFVQLICHTMVEHHNHDKTSLIGYNRITKHLSDYFEKGYHIFWDILSTQTQEVERRILFYLCKSMEEKNTTSIHKSEIEKCLEERNKKESAPDIEKALSHLERREIIRKSIEHPEYYEFTIGLYRYWVKWNLYEQ